jgi:hypothetical protein
MHHPPHARLDIISEHVFAKRDFGELPKMAQPPQTNHCVGANRPIRSAAAGEIGMAQALEKALDSCLELAFAVDGVCKRLLQKIQIPAFRVSSIVAHGSSCRVGWRRAALADPNKRVWMAKTRRSAMRRSIDKKSLLRRRVEFHRQPREARRVAPSIC